MMGKGGDHELLGQEKESRRQWERSQEWLDLAGNNRLGAKYAFSSKHSLWWKTVLKTGRNEKQRFKNEVLCRATDFRVLDETITV